MALLVLIVMAIFAFSLWSSLWQPSGIAMIAWIVGWGIGAGRIATRWPGFGWPTLCAVAMLLVWLPWTLRYGQTAWQSLYVFMFELVSLEAGRTGGIVQLPAVPPVCSRTCSGAGITNARRLLSTCQHRATTPAADCPGQRRPCSPGRVNLPCLAHQW